ncbi:hypothetical protein [Bailinhaonella thermotolerans]|uniref:Uncharacterized protein n=1 Tax=Bailinhaonella thermotolerans TaxID=1070861 RepID=A0A3A3ZY62_9ACTN|nr:hypothetical protein [Bailinhaonella thermotolerans]RJL20182.1 hypothetical protein D5H75_39740 [Bailinhaonella thermotolerans]
MAHIGTVTQAADSNHDRTPVRTEPIPGGIVQIPRSLLYSTAHGDAAVWVWSTYETLMGHGIGGRLPAIARRKVVAAGAGLSTTALDDVRRELLADLDGAGPYLARSAPRGRKRSVLHLALRLPRDTGEAWAPVPAWTLDLMWAGRRRPAGRVSPGAWRLYGVLVDRALRNGPVPRRLEETYARLGECLGVSPDTIRRRLRELETVGLAVVAGERGGWLRITVSLHPQDAERAAARYAEYGREEVAPRRDPVQIAALPPGTYRHSPLAESGTPKEAPTPEAPIEEAPDVASPLGKTSPARAREAAAADAAKPITGKGRPTPRRARTRVTASAAAVYRTLPAELTSRIPEHGSRRVLAAIAAELAHRTGAELADRAARNWAHFAARLAAGEQIRDAAALAVRLVRRGLACPDVRCEDGHQLDLDAACKACAAITADHAALSGALSAVQASTGVMGPETPPGAVTDDLSGSRVISPTPTPPTWRAMPPADTAAAVDRTARGRALARRLLTVRDPAEREAILAAHQQAIAGATA